MRKLLLLTTLTTLLAWGCSNEDNEVEEVANARPLIFHVSETPLDNPESAAARRTAPTTTATFSSFYYRYTTGSSLNGEANASKNASNQWTGGSWPYVETSIVVPFYAYANVSTTPTVEIKDGKVYMDFEVDAQTDSQKDLLVATASDTYENCKGNISFNFSHACGAVRFSISKTTGLSDYTVRVKSVTIYNIPSSGSYCFNDGTWTIDAEGKKNFSLISYDSGSMDVTAEKKTYLSGENDYMFLLPQTLTAWGKTGTPTNAYVEIECKIFNGETYKVGGAGTNEWGKAYLPLGIIIEKGKIHPVNISMGTALRDVSGNKYF